MHRILIVSESTGYLISSLQKKLEEAGDEVFICPANPDELSKAPGDIDIVFIFADEDLVGQHQGLIYLKDKVVEGDIPIFITGDSRELKAIIGDLPSHLTQSVFPRPINVNEVAEKIEVYLNTSAKDHKKKILVVDDSGAMLRNVKGWLEDKYQVILANSGAMAIKYLATSRPDLVLLDYEMPVVDGKQVLGMIRSEIDFSDIPVIFLTSKGDKESVMQVMSLKPDGYLLKTMPPEEITRAVDEFFQKRKAMGK